MIQPKVDEWGRQAVSGNAVITDPKEKLHTRLRNLLSLTQSPNEQEAAGAATRLRHLLVRHNLSVADLERKGGAAPGVRKEGHDLGKAAFKWKLDLAEGIAEFYYCAPLVNRKAKTVAFVGRPDNVEALTMLYEWVIEQIKNIARDERRKHFDVTGEHIDPLRWQLGFGEGAADRLIDRMKEMKAREQEDMSRNEYGDVNALAIHHLSEVSDWLESQGMDRMDGKKTKADLEREARYDRWRAEAAADKAAKAKLRAECEASGNMAPFYATYPEEHPDTIAAAETRMDDYLKREAKKEARNAKRRTGSYRSGPAIDWDKEEQADKARESGRTSADRINLQPFIGDSKAGERKGIK